MIATGAVRDEGTSYHYLPPNATVDAPLAPIPYLREELASLGMPVEEGCLWSTDAPYRETHEQIAIPDGVSPRSAPPIVAASVAGSSVLINNCIAVI